jgi:hypothetical protein
LARQQAVPGAPPVCPVLNDCRLRVVGLEKAAVCPLPSPSVSRLLLTAARAGALESPQKWRFRVVG